VKNEEEALELNPIPKLDSAWINDFLLTEIYAKKRVARV
jgi:hypothetical protein